MLWLASYPRSGNTFFRIVLHEVYGVESSEFPKHEDYADYAVVKTHERPREIEPGDPDIPAVYLVRDGRDTVVSMAHHRSNIIEPGSDYLTNLDASIVAANGSHFGGWSTHVEEWLERASLVIHFEDLIVDPIAELERLRPFLDLPKPERDRVPTFKDLRQRSYLTGYGKHLKLRNPQWRRKFFRRGRVGAWRDEMPLEARVIFMKQHGATMEKMGYAVKGEDETTVLAHRPRILLDGTKLTMRGMDGCKRYVECLAVGLRDRIDADDDDWDIDVLLGPHIYPLHLALEVASHGHRQRTLDERVQWARDRLHNWRATARGWLVARLSGVLTPRQLVALRDFKRRLMRQQVVEDGMRPKLQQERPLPRYDLVHATLPTTVGYLATLDAPVVVTVHDLCHIYAPQSQTRLNHEALRQGMLHHVARHATYLTVSDATRQALLEQYPVALECAKVTLLACDTDHFKHIKCQKKREAMRQRLRIPTQKYLLCLSTLEPRKNLDLVIKSYIDLVAATPEFAADLVIAGSKGWGYGRTFYRTIDRHPRIHRVGFVTEELLPTLYSGALALVYASRYEGFGLPILEAMSCGTPVIYGDTSAMSEVAGDGGLPVDAGDIAAIGVRMREIVEDSGLREALSKRALASAARFNWKRTAAQTAAHYRERLRAARPHSACLAQTAKPRTVVMQLPGAADGGVLELLREAVGDAQTSGTRHNTLASLSAEDLLGPRLFSGFYTYDAILAHIPPPRQVVTMLRTPVDRLVSAYNFGRAHRRSFIDARTEYTEKPGCYPFHGMCYAAAKDRGLCDFLRSEEPLLRSQMVRWIAGDEGSDAQMLERAKARLHQMAAIGFVEDMEVSVARIFTALGMDVPATIRRLGAFDVLPDRKEEMETAEKVAVDDEARALLSSITALDQELYDYAREITRGT